MSVAFNFTSNQQEYDVLYTVLIEIS